MRMFPYSPINYSAAELYDVRCTLGRESGMIRCISGSYAPPPLDLKQKTRFQIQKEKKMYVQHPYKYEGKYYAKIDGVFYEISKEVAVAMFAEYRNEIYRSRKWAPESEEDDQLEDFQDLENKQKKEAPADQKDKKWKRKTKRCEILDCAFSANSDGVSIADMADDTQMSMEEMVILKEESRMLHEKIGKLSLQEQFIIKSIYFDDMKQKDVAEILGVTKGALSQRLNTILRKMRNMYMEG